jgi:hypothetical protein
MDTVVPPTDADFEDFRTQCTTAENWGEVYKDSKITVWSRKSTDSAINIVKATTVFADVPAANLYDVLHDHEYRKTWDENMIQGYVIQMVNKHTEVGYYSAKMPTTISNRDFCNLRTWRADAARKEYIIFNYSVIHPDCPDKKGFVRARSLKTGYFVQANEDGGCTFTYFSQSDPKGWIPTWVINMLMTKLPSKILDNLHKVALAYPAWKEKHDPETKHWLNTVEDGASSSSAAAPSTGEKEKKKKKKKEEEEEVADE